MISPKHYEGNDVIAEEPIMIMYESMTRAAFEGYCIGNVIKYISRYRQKNGVEDLEKAKTYIQFLINQAQGRAPTLGIAPASPESEEPTSATPHYSPKIVLCGEHPTEGEPLSKTITTGVAGNPYNWDAKV